MNTKQIQWEQGVVSAIEHLIECTTSDAQAIMEAHEAKFPEELEVWFQNNMDPEGAARNVIGTSKENTPTPLMEEFLIMVNGASAFLDMEADEQVPDPIGDGTDLAREASDMVEQIREHYNELVAALENIMEVMEWENSESPEQAAYDQARAVLAKAK